jgi:hypothetical protein
MGNGMNLIRAGFVSRRSEGELSWFKLRGVGFLLRRWFLSQRSREARRALRGDAWDFADALGPAPIQGPSQQS